VIELTPEMYRACVSRDITALFRAVVAGGMRHRELAELVGMGQSEISEILAGRRVSSYEVLLRVADGLGIKRGIMGLAYTDGIILEPGVNEDVIRRRLLGLGSWALFGRAVLGELGRLPVVRADTPLPQRVGSSDVVQVAAVPDRLRALDRRYGGGGVYAAAHAHALHAERLMPLSASEAVRTRLASAVVKAHCLVGWSAYDVAETRNSLAYFGRALTYCDHASPTAARVLYTVAHTELNFGDQNYGLKLLQLAEIGLQDLPQSHQIIAFVLAEQALSYAVLGYSDKAVGLLRKSSDTYAAAHQEQGWPQERLSRFTGVVQLTLGQLETAAATLTSLVCQPPDGASRVIASDLTRLATVYLRSGEISRGGTAGRQSLSAAEAVPGSVRLTHRLVTLQQEAASRRNSSCQDLTRAVHTYLNR
jgi:transcriptional regulator with XRE-family HTH domain